MYCEKCGRLAHGNRPCADPTVVATRPRYAVAANRGPRRPQADSLICGMMSLFLPGLGQLCQGRIGAGLSCLFLVFLSVIALLLFWPLGLLGYLVVVIIAVVDAARA